ncbi:MAG: DUF1653 domain-containing protein [Lachnospiraceae bacterium]|nr:DUF1653 domain-containing protein [Lachnospiraceae bacterium]
MREIPRPYERYKHFKGREYQVLLIAKNEKTMEDMVIYQALYEPYTIYAREVADFLSPVDKEKYPNALQDERFTLIGNEAKDERAADKEKPVREEIPKENKQAEEAVKYEKQAEEVRQKEEKPAEEKYDNSGVDPVLMRFLDAEDGQEQLKVLEECAGKITARILTPMELSLGMEPSNESVDERIRNIRNNITTRMKYEIRR